MSKNDPDRMTLAERRGFASQVRSARVALGLTQTDLAKEAGVARQTISNLENGMAPQEGVLRSVLSALGISAGDGGRTYSPDTEMWIGLIGGALQALPPARRGFAGQSALKAVTDEIVNPAADVAPLREDLGLAARKRETEPTDES